MTFTEAVKTCLVDKYATFSGRATRSEYWYFVLFCYLVWFLVILLTTAVNIVELTAVICILLGILSLIPSYAVAFRRLHDTGRSAWHILWCIIPYIGSLILLVMFCLKSDEDNKYGPKPNNGMIER